MITRKLVERRAEIERERLRGIEATEEERNKELELEKPKRGGCC